MRALILLALLLPGCSWHEAGQGARGVTEVCLSLALLPVVPNAPARLIANGMDSPMRKPAEEEQAPRSK